MKHYDIGMTACRRPGMAAMLAGGAAALLISVSIVWGAIAPAFVTVDDAGNASDATGHGAVDYTYRIGAYEVTRTEYAAFLNAVAATDTHALYNSAMGIVRSGSAGNYAYYAAGGQKPVAFVSWYDALRFVNWLQNGQPVGPQGAATTEDGAYTFNSNTNVGPRNAGVQFFLPNEDEWVKAAYYQGGVDKFYWKYPTRSDALPVAESPPGSDNSVNYSNVVGAVTDVGAYSGTFGYYGTFDQAGNVWEWNESPIDGDRRLRGGCFDAYDLLLQAFYRDAEHPSFESAFIGFRVAAAVGGNSLPTFSLTVHNGNGDGRYTAGTVVNIAADPPATGQVFDRWTGDVGTLADPLAAATSVTMPATAVTVTATYRTYVPGSVTLISPTGSIGNDMPKFVWSREPQATWYQLWVNRDGVKHFAVWINGKTEAVPATPLSVGNYTWWVRPWSREYGYGPWSSPGYFSFGIPVLIAPAGGVLQTRTPGLTWTPVPAATWYKVSMNRNGKAYLSQWIRNATVWNPPLALPFGNYDWRVLAWSQQYGRGPWSAAGTFVLGQPLPLAPTGTVSSSPGMVRWDDASCIGATRYQIWINRSGATYWSGWTQSTQTVALPGAQREYTLPVSLQAGTYTWWIRARDAMGTGPWSQGESFSWGSPDNDPDSAHDD